MTRRYKSCPSAKTIARDFPFIVEIGVPPGGLGKRLNAMHAFHNQRGIQVAHVRHRQEDDRDLLLWVSPAEQSRKSLPLGSAAAWLR
jgi:hypothetical protein